MELKLPSWMPGRRPTRAESIANALGLNGRKLELPSLDLPNIELRNLKTPEIKRPEFDLPDLSPSAVGSAIGSAAHALSEGIGSAADSARSIGRDITSLRVTREPERPSMLPGVMLLGGLGAGMAVMFFLDPEEGNRRRALLQDKIGRFGRVAQRALRNRGEDTANRAQGLVHEARSVASGGGQGQEPDVRETPDVSQQLGSTDVAPVGTRSDEYGATAGGGAQSTAGTVGLATATAGVAGASAGSGEAWGGTAGGATGGDAWGASSGGTSNATGEAWSDASTAATGNPAGEGWGGGVEGAAGGDGWPGTEGTAATSETPWSENRG